LPNKSKEGQDMGNRDVKPPKSFRYVLVAALLLGVLSFAAWAAVNVTRFSNASAKSGEADGLVEPGGDRHNCYAWSMETMTDSDGVEYLYVGSNRDLIGMMSAQMGVSEDELVAMTSGDIPRSSGDYCARIFRKKLYGTGNKWEQIYISPTVQLGLDGASAGNGAMGMPLDMGYRGVVKYAAPGESAPSLYFGSMGYTTRLLKFGPDFKPGDEPTVVFETQSGTAASLRPLVVHGNKLYVGVLTASDDPASADLQVLGSATPGTDAWEPVADKNDFPGARLGPDAVGVGGIWDMISFNGYIYAFVGSYYTGASDDGFMVFKGKYVGTDEEGANAYGWKWQPIVCTAAGAKYPNGVGNSKNMTASPFLYSVGGKDYVYVGTLADAPTAFMLLLKGGDLQTFLDVLTPCQVYRFGADDEWEMIIGNTDESSGVFADRLGNYGAGFFNPPALTPGVPMPTGISSPKDLSLNLYAWRMGVYNGKLYVTTFDPGVVLDYAQNMVSDPVQKALINGLITAYKAYNDNPAGFDLYSTADGVNFTPITRDGFGDKFNYGGRTVRPTENGLYVGTANPFYGAQVWKVTDTPQGGGSSGCSAAGAYPAVLLLLALPLFARKRR